MVTFVLEGSIVKLQRASQGILDLENSQMRSTGTPRNSTQSMFTFSIICPAMAEEGLERESSLLLGLWLYTGLQNRFLLGGLWLHTGLQKRFLKTRHCNGRLVCREPIVQILLKWTTHIPIVCPLLAAIYLESIGVPRSTKPDGLQGVNGDRFIGDVLLLELLQKNIPM